MSTSIQHQASRQITNYAQKHGLEIRDAKMQMYQKNEKLANLMDSAVHVPLIGGVGLDALLGLVPVLGDVVSKLFSVSIITNAAYLGVPRSAVTRMIVLSFFDLLIGAVPVFGDIADVFFRANKRNIAVVRQHLVAEGVLDPWVLADKEGLKQMKGGVSARSGQS
jgi:hypothetical protein